MEAVRTKPTPNVKNCINISKSVIDVRKSFQTNLLKHPIKKTFIFGSCLMVMYRLNSPEQQPKRSINTRYFLRWRWFLCTRKDFFVWIWTYILWDTFLTLIAPTIKKMSATVAPQSIINSIRNSHKYSVSVSSKV